MTMRLTSRLAMAGLTAAVLTIAGGAGPASAQTPTAGTDISGKPVYLRKLSVLRYSNSFTARIYTLTTITLQVTGRGVCDAGWCPLRHNNVDLFARRNHVDLSVPQGTPVVTERTLRPGDEGEDVRAIQEVLAKKGAKLTVNGRYDAVTVEAVRDFQRKNGLVVDGTVGPETRKKLVG